MVSQPTYDIDGTSCVDDGVSKQYAVVKQSWEAPRQLVLTVNSDRALVLQLSTLRIEDDKLQVADVSSPAPLLELIVGHNNVKENTIYPISGRVDVLLEEHSPNPAVWVAKIL